MRTTPHAIWNRPFVIDEHISYFILSTVWRKVLVLVLALALLSVSPGYAKEPFYEGLGTYTRQVSTDSAEAQRYFNQGLAFLQGFNHGAAIRSFEQAAELDPECAMA